jgi:NAD(P)-dependent dehydrogenase (short-subunit alcohol dehydrogenase family)
MTCGPLLLLRHAVDGRWPRSYCYRIASVKFHNAERLGGEDAMSTAAVTPDLFSVAGRSVLITGATGALGGAAARALAVRGARLTLAGGNASALAALVEELGGASGGVASVAARPERPADAAAMVDAAVATHGGLDGVLVASGMNHVAPITDMDVEDFDRVQDANVRGSWLVCQAAGRQLLAQGRGGGVVLVSSTRGRLGHPAGYSAYCPSKAAVDLLAKTLAAEWGPQQIRVNAIAPTVFRSDLTAWMYADDDKGRSTRAAMLARIPLGRLAEPEDFVGTLVYLLSAASSFLTGQVIYLDGGYTAC